MPKMSIHRSVIIRASADKVFTILNDFNQWTSWSPWLIMDPNAKVTIRDDKKYYEWDGTRVGSGNMTIMKENNNRSIDYDLKFLKPWKSQADVSFILDPDGDSTKVTWTMNSSLPFFLFWMKNQMEAYVGMDYQRGLMMLKELVEEGEIKSKLEFKGESQFKETKYVGIRNSCAIAQVGEQMKSDFGKLNSYLRENQDNATGKAFSIYHKWDPVKGKVDYTGVVAIKEFPNDLPAGMITGSIPATKVYTLRHVGAYEHLGNAWSTLYAMHRSKEFKTVKGIHPFEDYVTNPNEVAPKDSITDIHFPIK